MNTIVYLLYYDHDGSGTREEWNTFHTPCEAFASDLDRDLRMRTLKAQDPDLEFHKVDIDVPPAGGAPIGGGGGTSSSSSNSRSIMMIVMITMM